MLPTTRQPSAAEPCHGGSAGTAWEADRSIKGRVSVRPGTFRSAAAPSEATPWSSSQGSPHINLYAEPRGVSTAAPAYGGPTRSRRGGVHGRESTRIPSALPMKAGLEFDVKGPLNTTRNLLDASALATVSTAKSE